MLDSSVNCRHPKRNIVRRMQFIEAGPGLLNMYLQVTERKTAGFNFFFAVQNKELVNGFQTMVLIKTKSLRNLDRRL